MDMKTSTEVVVSPPDVKGTVVERPPHGEELPATGQLKSMVTNGTQGPENNLTGEGVGKEGKPADAEGYAS